jgi:hypothetical protein
VKLKLIAKTPRALDNVWRPRIEVVGRDLANTAAGPERGNVKAIVIVLWIEGTRWQTALLRRDPKRDKSKHVPDPVHEEPTKLAWGDLKVRSDKLNVGFDLSEHDHKLVSR